ncbi:MAG: ATP-binding protein [Pseudomonadota bacterium]
MAFLRSYTPRGIYARAALIVALPFLALQLLVSLVFVQRHFEDVTRQMVRTQEAVISLILEEARTKSLATVAAEYATPLGYTIADAEALPVPFQRIWYDVSGLTIRERLGEAYDLRALDLSNIRRVSAWIAQDGRLYEIGFERRKVSARSPHQLLVLMVAAGIVMIAISFIFLRNQLRPIRRLARAAEAFGRGRPQDYTPSGAVEVRAAGAAFLDMRARIERQIEQRTLLLSGVSHDLRTPLTRMRLALSMMEDGGEVAELRHDVDDMNKMIDAFLDFARVSAGEEAQETDLAGLLEDVLSDAARGKITVELEGDLPSTILSVRPMGLSRAITNLISNAARYGTRVRLSVTLFERSVRIRVEDDGPGIPEEERDAAMRPFTRLDSARSQNAGGSVGLGLAIAADTARRHGGSLRLSESEDLGGLCADLILAR